MESDSHEELHQIPLVSENQLSEAESEDNSVSFTLPIMNSEDNEGCPYDEVRVKEELKDEITTEEHEVCLDSVEHLPIKEECGTVDAGSSATDDDMCVDGPLSCSGETDPLAGSEGGSKTPIDNHTEDKPFKCDVCWKGFARRGHLVVHTRIHTGAVAAGVRSSTPSTVDDELEGGNSESSGEYETRSGAGGQGTDEVPQPVTGPITCKPKKIKFGIEEPEEFKNLTNMQLQRLVLKKQIEVLRLKEEKLLWKKKE